MKLSTIQEVAKEQFAKLKDKNGEINRDLRQEIPEIFSHAIIISGIRRCGKSTLLYQIARKKEDVFFLNFEDFRLYDFEIEDFELIDIFIKESNKKILFFDEIQIINGWEKYVRQKIDEGFQVYISGSNASLLSMELGTKLTGRHITKELFPFSYTEFLRFTRQKTSDKSLLAYIKTGGFPQYILSKQTDILKTLVDDIVYKDIAVRYSVRDIQGLKKLTTFLLSNTASLVVPSKLKQMLNIKSASTVLNYFSYFENTYLIQLILKFSWSVRSQMLAPKKMYIIDTGLVQSLGFSFSENYGKLLETVVFWELRRKFKEIYYFNENNAECDFVVQKENNEFILIQVCWELNIDNEKREIKGLLEAMDFFDEKEGFIVTFNSDDVILKDGKKIRVVNFCEFVGLG